ncbi:MAG TPA: RNA polymerase sigma factor [Bacteroidota bacterium]|jgi:RNA polymerase sigma-70 factor (ECF subfamily)|nr:RNA polymerase sigma factor [Bacteroidota bacterium]
MSAEEERKFVLQAQQGDMQAFRLLVDRYMKQAYNIAYGVMNDHEDAEDVAQESFVRIFNSIKSFRGDAQFSTWLYRIVMNTSLNHVSKRKSKASREVHVPDQALFATEADVASRHQPDVQSHIERALHELPTLQRAVVILRHLNGLSTKQVSGILRCSEGTVKTHLHRGLKKMRTLLGFLESEIV